MTRVTCAADSGMGARADGTGHAEAGASSLPAGGCCRSSSSIFEASIEELTGEDYSEAPAGGLDGSLADDEAFAEKLTTGLTLVATVDGSPVGFIALQGQRASSSSSTCIRPWRARGSARCSTTPSRSSPARAALRVLSPMSATMRCRFFQKQRLPAAAPQHHAARRRMARQHHHGKASRAARKTGSCRHEPRPRLSLRHHPARRRADHRRRFLARGQARDRRRSSTSSASTTSRAAIPAPTRSTPRSSPRSARRTPSSPPSA